ncbi:MAG: hypothetical protein JW924_05135 [Fusobacteriaceae bacterium]|nr:hypothetical protein [Fusobacteriaceae bacterium]
MVRKFTISLPEELYDSLCTLKEEYDMNSISSVVGLSVTLLEWIVKQEYEGFTTTSTKEKGNKVIERELPIILPGELNRRKK